MTIIVRAGRARRRSRYGNAPRNWLVIDDRKWAALHLFEPGMPVTHHHAIRTYVCTEWPDAMRLADDLASGRDVDPWMFIAMSERRV